MNSKILLIGPLSVLVAIILFFGIAYVILEVDHDMSYENADFVFYGEILSVDVLTEPVQTQQENKVVSVSSGKANYSIKVHDSIKNSFEDEVIFSYGFHAEENQMSAAPTLYKVGDKLVFYIEILNSDEYLIDYDASYHAPFFGIFVSVNNFISWITGMEKDNREFESTHTFSSDKAGQYEKWCKENNGHWDETEVACGFMTQEESTIAHADLESRKNVQVDELYSSIICHIMQMQCPENPQFDGSFSMELGRTYVTPYKKGMDGTFYFDASDPDILHYRICTAGELDNYEDECGWQSLSVENEVLYRIYSERYRDFENSHGFSNDFNGTLLEPWCVGSNGVWEKSENTCFFVTDEDASLAEITLEELKNPQISPEKTQAICEFLGMECPSHASFKGNYDLVTGQTTINYVHKEIKYQFDVTDSEIKYLIGDDSDWMILGDSSKPSSQEEIMKPYVAAFDFEGDELGNYEKWCVDNGGDWLENYDCGFETSQDHKSARNELKALEDVYVTGKQGHILCSMFEMQCDQPHAFAATFDMRTGYVVTSHDDYEIRIKNDVIEYTRDKIDNHSQFEDAEWITHLPSEDIWESVDRTLKINSKLTRTICNIMEVECTEDTEFNVTFDPNTNTTTYLGSDESEQFTIKFMDDGTTKYKTNSDEWIVWDELR